MRPHFLGAARGRPALPVLRRLLATLLAAAVALLGLVALSTSTAPSAHAADPPVRNLLRPTIYNDPPKVGDLAFAHLGTWYPTPDAVTLTWYRSGSTDPIGTGNPIFIPVEALGETLTVRATATKAGYADATATSSASTAVVAGTPTNYVEPVIFGEPAVGSTVVVWEGAWSVEADSYSYRWFQEGTAEPIGTDRELVVPAGAAGKEITAEVTLTAARWDDGVATSDPVTAYDPGSAPVQSVVKPTISDAPTVGGLAVVHPGVWDPQPDAVDLQWFRSGSTDPIGSGPAIVVPAAAHGETLTVRATASKAGRTDAVATSDPSAPVGDGALQSVERPAIFGAPVVGGVVEVWEGIWSATPSGYSYRWLVEGSDDPVGTGKQLTVPASAAGKALTVEVTATRSLYADGVATSVPVTAAAEAPGAVQSVTAPSITGTPKVGETLAASTGTWDPAPDATTVTWFRSGSTDPIGTGEELVVPAEAEGELIGVVVTATKAGSADGVAFSAPQGPVLPAGAASTVQSLVAPSVSGSPRVGRLAGVHPGVWSPAPDEVTLEWFRSGSTDPIGTGTVIVVPAEAEGETLTVRATAAKAGYTAGEATSAPSDVVGEGTLEAASDPAIYGTPMAGATVVAYEGLWPASPDGFGYRWFAEGSDEPIGTGKELVVPADAAGKELTVEVTATKAGYADAVVTSAPVTVEETGSTQVANLLEPRVLTDPPKVGELAYAHVGVWSPQPDDVQVQWFRSGSTDPIGTGIAIVVPSAAQGETLSVKVTVSKAGYADGTLTSEQSATVGAGTVQALVPPQVPAAAKVGDTIVAHVGVWSPGPDSVEVRWFRSGSTDPIGTGNAIVVPAEALGETLTVEVTATRAGFTEGRLTSAPSSPVTEGVQANLVQPAILGAPVAGATVQAWEGIWSVVADSYTYRWLAAGSAQPIGTGKQLVIPADAVGKAITVEVTAHKSGYADEVVSSGSITVSTSAACTTATSAVDTATAAQAQAAAEVSAAQAKVAKLKAKKKAAKAAGKKAKVAKVKAKLAVAKAARKAAVTSLADAAVGLASAQTAVGQNCS
ncbi:hypothetical protein [Nocardioides humi]